MPPPPYKPALLGLRRALLAAPPACHWPAPLPRPLRAAHWLVLRARPSPAVSGWPPAALPARRPPLAPFPAIPLAIGRNHRLAWPLPSNVALGKRRRTALRVRATTGAWWILTGPRAPRDQPGTRGAARLGPARPGSVLSRLARSSPGHGLPLGVTAAALPAPILSVCPRRWAPTRPGTGPVSLCFKLAGHGDGPGTEEPGGRGRANPAARVCLRGPGTAEGPGCWCAPGGEGPGRCPCRAPGVAAPAHAGPEQGRAAGSRPRPGDRQPGAAQSRCCSVLRARAAPGARRFPYGTGVPRVLPGAAARSLLRPVLNDTLLSAPGRVQRGLGRQS